MKKLYDENEDNDDEDDNVIDDVNQDGDEDVDEDDETGDDDETEEEETYLQSLMQEVVDLHEDIVNTYVVDPDTPQELSQNESTKKFLVQRVRKRLLDSFESQQQWAEDVELLAMVKKCKREMSKNDELSALTAMKRIIKNEEKIGELVEAAIEEQVGADDDDDGVDDDDNQ